MGLLAGPAAADGERYHDPAGDQLYTIGGHGNTTPPYLTPSHRAGDVVKIATRTTATRVTVRVTFRKLTAHGRRLDFVLSTKPGRTYELVDDHFSGGPPPSVTFTRNGKVIECPGLREVVDREADVASLSVPRSCLGNATSVRTGFVGLWAKVMLGSSYADDARQTGTTGRTGTVAMGPEVSFG